MIIYTDKFSGDEFLSDTYGVKLVDDVVYEADCQMVKSGGIADVDIGALHLWRQKMKVKEVSKPSTMLFTLSDFSKRFR